MRLSSIFIMTCFLWRGGRGSARSVMGERRDERDASRSSTNDEHPRGETAYEPRAGTRERLKRKLDAEKENRWIRTLIFELFCAVAVATVNARWARLLFVLLYFNKRRVPVTPIPVFFLPDS